MTNAFHITRYNHPAQNWLDAVLSLRAEFGDKASSKRFNNFILPRLTDETMLLALAWDGERPVGYGLAFDVPEHPFMPEWTRAGYITQFLVTHSYRKCGVGRLLMAYLNDWFISRGLTKVLLNVNIDNEIGQRFWQSQGFEAYATRLERIRHA